MARPSKFTPEVALSILNFVRSGNSQDAASQASGINPATYYNWQKKASAGDKRYVKFFEDVKQAKAEAEVRNVMIISDAAEKSWQAAAWWLERRNPDVWARRDEYRRESEKPTHINIVIKGEEEEDDKRDKNRQDIQPAQSTA